MDSYTAGFICCLLKDDIPCINSVEEIGFVFRRVSKIAKSKFDVILTVHPR